MEKKFISILFLIVCTSFIIGCSASKKNQNPDMWHPERWKHFRVELTTEDTKEVDILQDSLEITPHQSSVVLCVNITDDKMSYLVFGEEKDPTAKVYAWFQIPKSTKEYLLNYSGPKKYNLSIVK